MDKPDYRDISGLSPSPWPEAFFTTRQKIAALQALREEHPEWGCRKLARSLRCSHQTVWRLLKGKTYRGVPYPPSLFLDQP